MSWVTAALLVCSSGDPATAAVVVEQAVVLGVDPALALAVACLESGVRGANPMGVRACYRTGKFDQSACILIGVQSLKNRLRGCGGAETCALRRYNDSKKKHAYAAHGVRLAKVIRRNQ